MLTKPFEMHIYIKASADRVRDAWIGSNEVTNWFVTGCEYYDAAGSRVERAVSGGSYRWKWVEGTEDRAPILTVGPGLFAFGWYQGKGQVTVRFQEEGFETRVTLKQEMFEGSREEIAEIQLGCRLGWTFFMANLKAYLECGVDLRETDPRRAGAINV